MERLRDLVEETLNHFAEGAKSVRAYSNDTTYIITKASDPNEFWVATEEPGFPKSKTKSLKNYFTEVFGIEAKY
jgi:frataxin-like iron-binding protein CyaY